MSKRKWMILTALLLAASLFAVMVVVAVGAGLFFYTRTPTYSLGRAQESIENRDRVTFERYVDIDTLTSRGFDDLIATEDDAAAATIAMLAKGPVKVQMKESFLSAFDAPSATKKKEAEKLFVALQSLKLLEVDQRGKVAMARVELTDPDSEEKYVVELSMQDQGGYWRVTHIANLIELIEDMKARARAKGGAEADSEW